MAEQEELLQCLDFEVIDSHGRLALLKSSLETLQNISLAYGLW
jgi:hypothetical protein